MKSYKEIVKRELEKRMDFIRKERSSRNDWNAYLSELMQNLECCLGFAEDCGLVDEDTKWETEDFLMKMKGE